MEDHRVALAADSWVACAPSYRSAHALPELEADRQYALVIVDTADLRLPGQRPPRRPLAAALAAARRRRTVAGPAFYRSASCGKPRPAQPVAPAEQILLPRGARLPPLIGPLLQTLDWRRWRRVTGASRAKHRSTSSWAASPWSAKVPLYDARGHVITELRRPAVSAARRRAGKPVGTERAAIAIVLAQPDQAVPTMAPPHWRLSRPRTSRDAEPCIPAPRPRRFRSQRPPDGFVQPVERPTSTGCQCHRGPVRGVSFALRTDGRLRRRLVGRRPRPRPPRHPRHVASHDY